MGDRDKTETNRFASDQSWLSNVPVQSRVMELLEDSRPVHGDESASNWLKCTLEKVGDLLRSDWVAVAGFSAQWTWRTQCAESLQPQLLNESLDQDGVVSRRETGRLTVSCPLAVVNGEQLVLVAGGRNIDPYAVPSLRMLTRLWGREYLARTQLERQIELAGRLRQTLQAAARVGGVVETVPLLEALADEATQLLACERASIFIWDKPSQKLLACPALGVEGRTLYLADNAGIVGNVVHSGSTVIVNDPYADPRFDRSVDKKSGYRTRNLICVPLFDRSNSIIGAFECMSRRSGSFSPDDADVLTQLGVQASVALRNVQERERLLRNHRQMSEQMAARVRIIGESTSTSRLRDDLVRLSLTDLPVLILGESGTGKEVAAQSLHFRGARSEHLFVAVNCAALTESLLESELFGHEKGAFTDARDTHKGKFELADGGTIFLDEIGDMSLAGQAKLLRVLEQKIVTRVGGAQTIPVNVRVVAATNQNLVEAVRNRRFREDLYYRLNVVTLELLPLRQRTDDILPLAEFFLTHFCVQARRAVPEISGPARQRLLAHPWPGNVRELRNLMERVAFLSTGPVVDVADFAFVLSPRSETIGGGQVDPAAGLSEATVEFQQRHIEAAIRRAGGNMTEAARLLGLHRSNLYRKMRQVGMTVPDDARD